MEKEWTEKETSLRAQFTRERDQVGFSVLFCLLTFVYLFQEIDRVIEKLEFEMKKARDDSEKSTEARIGRLKAKHETEIGDKNILIKTKHTYDPNHFIRRAGKRD